MSKADTLQYVKAASKALGLNLDDERAQRVAEHFERTQALAASLEKEPLTPEDELAEIYRPAPYPAPESKA
ncbi:DUF4089 domain-containing protein [Variovorax sp. VNK109]|uniref:DUF4089 domain-containing protein n=1 Tax=Variovorax sp. VNK109 TaxID=3400919 RepID=UPI003C056719